MLKEASSLLGQTQSMLTQFDLVREKRNLVMSEQERAEADREQKSSSLINDDPRSSEEEMKDQERAANDRPGSAGNQAHLTKADEELDIIFKASQIAPILDRVGRLMCDLAPNLNNLVRNHQRTMHSQMQAHLG